MRANHRRKLIDPVISSAVSYMVQMFKMIFQNCYIPAIFEYSLILHWLNINLFNFINLYIFFKSYHGHNISKIYRFNLI